MKEKLIKSIVFILILIIIFIDLNGCAPKPRVIEKPVYIETPLPELHKFQAPKELNISKNGKPYIKNGKVCVPYWQDACLPKDKMIELINYCKELRGTVSKYEIEIDNYNKFREKK